jgi:cytochrome c1
MREIQFANKDIQLKLTELENKIGNQDQSIQQLFEYLRQLVHQENEPRKRIGFKE